MALLSQRPQRPRRLRFSFFKPDCQRTGENSAAEPIDFTLSAATGFPALAVHLIACRENQTAEPHECVAPPPVNADICSAFRGVNSRSSGADIFLAKAPAEHVRRMRLKMPRRAMWVRAAPVSIPWSAFGLRTQTASAAPAKALAELAAKSARIDSIRPGCHLSSRSSQNQPAHSCKSN
jgi:hypothetical protein